MKKLFLSLLMIPGIFLYFTGCPCTCVFDDLSQIEGVEAVLDKSLLASDNLVKVTLKGSPKIKEFSNKEFQSCNVRITVVRNDGADDEVKILQLKSSSNPAYDEWKYYDNDKKCLEVLSVRADYAVKNGESVNDEIVLEVNKNTGFYVFIDYELYNKGIVAEKYFHLYLDK